PIEIHTLSLHDALPIYVRDHEVGVMYLPVEGHQRQHHPGQSTGHEYDQEAEDPQHRQAPDHPPGPQGGQPGEHLDGGGNRHQHAGQREERLGQLRNAHGEHVVHPQPEADEAHGDDRQYQPAVPDDGPAGYFRQQSGDNPRRGQEDDVHLRVTEQPEQMLPQQRVPATGGVKERDASGTLQLQQHAGQNQGRDADDDHQRHDQDVP